MAKVPWPPAAPPPPLRAGDIVRLAAGNMVWRVYFAGGAYPSRWSQFRHYGPTANRFDHHLSVGDKAVVQARGVQYGAPGATTCLAEVFQATRVIDRTTGSARLVGYELTRNVHLLDLAGAFITRAGAAPAINAVRKDKARAWARYFYQHYPDIDGLSYHSSMYAHRDAYALFERATNALPATPTFDRALSDPVLGPRLAAAAVRIGYLIF